MKFFPSWFVAVCLTGAAFMITTACGDAPAPVAKQPAAPPVGDPISGRQAMQYMTGAARTWASDAQPLTVRSVYMKEVKPEPGRAGAWEVMFVSETKAGARLYTWSAVELENIHKGIFPGPPESWRSAGQQKPFTGAEIKVDSTDALQAAIKESATYLGKSGTKPPVNFLLEFNKAERYPGPIWRVMWGASMSSAEYVATVDAVTGKVVAH